jgi:hypothetical protein
MKIKNYLPTIILLFSIVFSAFAQETRIVKVDGWDPASSTNPVDYENLLYYAIEEDSAARVSNPNVIFELKRNHVYFLGKQIEYYDFHLHIRAEAGEGLLPEIQASAKSDGTYGLDYIKSYNDLTLENISINGLLPDGGYQHWVIECRGNGSTINYKGCSFDSDRASPVCARADSLKIFISDCTMGNIGYRTAFGGNGRMIDLRPEAQYLDTLVITNSTTYHMSDRIIRNMNTRINYLFIDHLTAINTLGLNGGLQLGDCKHATVKNSIFANVIMLGHCDAHIAEQTQPEDPPRLTVITLDKIYNDGSYVIKNNNIFWDESVIGVWDQIDSVSQPDFVNPLLEEAVGSENVADMYFTEQLSFTQVCPPKIAYVALYYADPAAGTYPDSWCVGGEDGYFYDQYDASYPETTTSFTAGDDGMPLGNLNHFSQFTSIKESQTEVFKNRSVKVYPNPFQGELTIAYQLENEQKIEISIFDVTGKKVASVLNARQAAGYHDVKWDRTNSNGTSVVAGYYLYQIKSSSWVYSGSLVISE